MDIGLMNTENATFTLSKNGFLCLSYNGEEHKNIGVRRIMPQSMPYEFISITDSEQKEICIIENLDDLSEEQKMLIKNELDVRYYTPTITRVETLKDKMGFLYIDVILNDRKKCVTIKDVSKNIKLIGTQMLAIFDIDGNRYIIPNINELDRKSMQLLGPYLF